MGPGNTTPRAPSAVMRLLRSIVSGGAAASPRQQPNNVLRFLESQHAREGSTATPVEDPEGRRDPAREAAMNHIRRLRIHAA